MIDLEGYIHWRPEFLKVADPRFYPPEWLDHQVVTGEAQLLKTEHAAILVDMKVYPSGARDVHGVVAAGDLNDICNLLIPAAEAWGRQFGCIGACLESREGWVKALRPSGYVAEQVVLRKDFGA
jgi:hypothetical protein